MRNNLHEVMVYNNLVSLQYDCFQKPDWIHIPSKHLPVQINIETLEKGGEICSKLMIKTPTRSTIKKTTTNQLWQYYCSIWADFTHCSGVSIVDFEQVNVAWVCESYLRHQLKCKIYWFHATSKTFRSGKYLCQSL